MAILKSCCCGAKSIRSGSFASGIYTLASYTIFVAVGALHVNVVDITALFILSLLLLLFSGLCVTTSVILLVGLCVDNRRMLIPWMLSVSMTTVLDLALCSFFIVDENTTFDVCIWLLFLSDIVMCLLNVYCVLCVFSQYQEYCHGRGRPEGDQRRRRESFILPPPKINNIPLTEEAVTNYHQVMINLNDDFDEADNHSTSHSNVPSCHSPTQTPSDFESYDKTTTGQSASHWSQTRKIDDVNKSNGRATSLCRHCNFGAESTVRSTTNACFA